VVQGDVLVPETLTAAMQGVRVVYYLVHSLAGGSNFSERDMRAARNCAAAALAAGVDLARKPPIFPRIWFLAMKLGMRFVKQACQSRSSGLQ
jgi:hypothetical protein